MLIGISKMTGTNLGGICPKLKIVFAHEVQTFGDVIDLKIPAITLQEGKQWSLFEPTKLSAHPVEQFVQQDQGNGFPFQMPFTISKITREKKLKLLEFTRFPIILDYTDRNGSRCVVGTKEEPAVLIYKQKSQGRAAHDGNRFDVVIQCTRRQPIPIED